MAISVVTILDATVKVSTVLILAGLGELISERSGVLNLGIEGIMLVGALSGFASTVVTGSPAIGFLLGVGAGTLFSLIHAVLTVTLKSDQAISGITLTLLGTGLTTFFGSAWAGKSIDGFSQTTLPVIGGLLRQIPILGEAFFYKTPTAYLAFLALPAVWYLFNRTNLGLEIVAVGEDPETADSAGVNVFQLQYLCVLLSGAFAGGAGAHLSLSFSQLWANGMVAGRGWIAVALVIFAQWRPAGIFVGAYIFGAIEAIALRIQGFTPTVGEAFPFAELFNAALAVLSNPTVMSTYPYIVTILALVYTTIQFNQEYGGPPGALLDAYSREAD